MEIKTLNFDSWEEVKANLSLLSGAEESNFKHLNTIEKTFSKQMNDSLQFISLKGNHSQIKILLGNDLFCYHTNSNLEHNIENWKLNKLIKTSHDVLCLIGFELLDIIQRQIGSLESFMNKFEAEILKNPKKSQQAEIIRLHRDTIRLKKQLNNYFPIFIRNKQKMPLWDELIINMQSNLDDSRNLVELMENMREAYQASMDNKANDIMKLLTILATIFLPINILTSFFGMNFERMPLIHNYYGMDILYLSLFIIVSVIFLVLKKKNWL